MLEKILHAVPECNILSSSPLGLSFSRVKSSGVNHSQIIQVSCRRDRLKDPSSAVVMVKTISKYKYNVLFNGTRQRALLLSVDCLITKSHYEPDKLSCFH